MPSATAQLKSRLKHGPRMSRQMRAEYLLVEVGSGPRTLTPATLAKIRGELARLSQSTDARVRQFVALMAERYPGVCDEIRL
jgi:hypothetical protein